MDSVGENLHGEFALDKLDRKILLAARRIDDVQTVAGVVLDDVVVEGGLGPDYIHAETIVHRIVDGVSFESAKAKIRAQHTNVTAVDRKASQRNTSGILNVDDHSNPARSIGDGRSRISGQRESVKALDNHILMAAT